MSEDPDAAGVRMPHLRALAPIIGAVATPPALVVALAYYFAVKRQETLALHFGIDTSVLGYSVQDYLLRGGDALFLVLLFASLIGLAAIAIHVGLTRHAETTWPKARLRALGVALQVAGGVLLAVGLVAVFEPVPLNPLVRSLSFGTGMLLLAYGIYLGDRVRGGGFLFRPGRRGFEPLLVASLALIGVVVSLSVFWATKDLAEALGRGQARRLERSLSNLPGAIVYSERRLHLPGVSEAALSGPGYRFRYSGLRLLVRSAGRYFLVPQGWTRADGVVVVLRDDQTMRVEFTRGGRR